MTEVVDALGMPGRIGLFIIAFGLGLKWASTAVMAVMGYFKEQQQDHPFCPDHHRVMQEFSVTNTTLRVSMDALEKGMLRIEAKMDKFCDDIYPRVNRLEAVAARTETDRGRG